MTTVYQWPAAWGLEQCSLVLIPNVRMYESQYTHAADAVDFLGEFFRMTGRMPRASLRDGGAREAFFNKLRGSNLIAAWHFGRPRPKGTQRGTPTINGAVAQLALALPMMNGTDGATFEPGDMLRVGAQLFQVADLATFNASGQATVNVVNRVRSAISNGTAVLWDKPTTNWRLASPPPVSYEGMTVMETEFELIETW